MQLMQPEAFKETRFGGVAFLLFLATTLGALCKVDRTRELARLTEYANRG